jgi:hypothetical protein
VSREPATEEELAERLRTHLEAEHSARLEQLSSRQKRERTQSLERVGDADAQRVERQVREAFYKDHGYKEYIDSHGRRSMIPPEEWEWKQSKRSQRKRKRGSATRRWSPRRLTTKTLATYLMVIVLAVVVGILLAR